MKALRNLIAPSMLLGAVLGSQRVSSAVQTGGGVPQVTCNGQACGGTGANPFQYRVKPNGQSISSVEVGVEDGDVNHYSLLTAPTGWGISIVSTARPHDIGPTNHGSTTSSVGSCPFALKFSKGTGSPQLAAFNLGYSYNQPNTGFHDVTWKAGNQQTGWTFSVGGNNGPVHSPIRMNVLFIVLDDVGTDQVTSFDDPTHTHAQALTPELDTLADAGIRFRNFYVNPLCSTTRACFQTGRFSIRHGMGQLAVNPTPVGYMLPDCEATIAECLKGGLPSGEEYTCGAFGKYHVTPAYDISHATHAVRNGYDRFFGALGNTGDHYNWTKIEHNVGWIDPVIIQVSNQWSAEVVRTDATNWINAATRPYFAYVCFNPPHATFSQAPPEETDEATPRALLSPGTVTALQNALPHGPEDYPLIYRSMIEAVDSEIKYLLDDIGERRENTMIFIAADNGTPGEMVDTSVHTAGHAKSTVYQLGVRVPMIVNGPLAAPGDCTELVGAVDLWSTIAAVAGASPVTNTCADTTIDSISFLPLIEDPTSTGSRTFAFSQLFVPNGVMDSSTFVCLDKNARAITDGTYKYIRRLDLDGDTCPQCNGNEKPCTYEQEFYKISTDPDELYNFFDIGWTPGANAAYQALSNLMDQLSEF